MKAAVSKMSSTRQRLTTFHARASSNLKPGILENRAFLEEERKGKKRGPYRTSQTKSKRWDTVDIDPTVFEEVIDVDGREYLVLLTGGRIPIEYKDLYMYVVTGKVPDSWIKAFEECKLLSATKIEQAKHSTQ